MVDAKVRHVTTIEGVPVPNHPKCIDSFPSTKISGHIAKGWLESVGGVSEVLVSWRKESPADAWTAHGKHWSHWLAASEDVSAKWDNIYGWRPSGIFEAHGNREYLVSFKVGSSSKLEWHHPWALLQTETINSCLERSLGVLDSILGSRSLFPRGIGICFHGFALLLHLPEGVTCLTGCIDCGNSTHLGGLSGNPRGFILFPHKVIGESIAKHKQSSQDRQPFSNPKLSLFVLIILFLSVSLFAIKYINRAFEKDGVAFFVDISLGVVFWCIGQFIVYLCAVITGP